MAGTENTGKIRLRRGSTSEWANQSLYEGQPGIEYLASGKARMKVGPETSPEGGETQWSSCKYIAPDPDIYTDTAVTNTSDKLAITTGEAGTANAYLRNIVVSPNNPSSADSYVVGTVWLKYE